MNDHDFRTLVNSMRMAQRRYFKTRCNDAKRESIALEQKVDEELLTTHKNESGLTQPRLF